MPIEDEDARGFHESTNPHIKSFLNGHRKYPMLIVFDLNKSFLSELERKNLDHRILVWLKRKNLDMKTQKRGERNYIWWTHKSMNLNARKTVGGSEIRTWTHYNLVKANKPAGESTKVWTWTHEVCWTLESLDMNARKSGEHTKSGHERSEVWTWTHESLVNTRKSGNERTKVWWTHEILDMNARKSAERTKVWTKTTSVWDSLDIGTFRLGRSGHTCFCLAPFFTFNAFNAILTKRIFCTWSRTSHLLHVHNFILLRNLSRTPSIFLVNLNQIQ